MPQSYWFDIPSAQMSQGDISMSSSPALSSGRPRILVADDQPTVLEALRMMLKNEGYETELAETPHAALELVRAKAFDAALIDLNYTLDTTSGTEGMDLLTEIKKVRPDTPVVVMTAWATLETAIEAMRRGASDFIQKPWDNAQVLNTVRAQVMRAQLERHATKQRDFEIADASDVQKALLPREMPSLPGYDVAAWLQPARGVTGDYYDLFQLDDDRAFLCIGDVAGKGTAAALLMANLQGTLKTLVLDERSPAALCRRLNPLVAPNLPARFISFFCAVLEFRTGNVSYCNAGHLAPVVVRNSAAIARLHHGGPVLGCLEASDYAEGQFSMLSGDSIVLFTDGITEAGAQSINDEFGEERLIRVIDTRTCPSASALRDAISHAVMQHTAEFEDDATLIALRRL